MSEAKLSFEDARSELAEIVSKLESGGLTLEESLALWQRGEEVAAMCSTWLDEARARLNAALEEKSGDGDD